MVLHYKKAYPFLSLILALSQENLSSGVCKQNTGADQPAHPRSMERLDCLIMCTFYSPCTRVILLCTNINRYVQNAFRYEHNVFRYVHNVFRYAQNIFRYMHNVFCYVQNVFRYVH